jgi:hypothetical protein
MPPLTRWFIKTALVYLVAALVVGVGLAADVRLGPGTLLPLRAVYLHLFLLGWVTQMIFGVAYWMFPRASRERPRGREWMILATYLLLNAGLLLRAVGEPLDTLRPGAAVAWLLLVSAALQWLAGLLFVINIWGRVKER